MFPTYPMPDSAIKKVVTFGTGKQDGFNFADQNGALFEWNDEVNALKGEGLIKEDVVLYPSITREFPRVALTCHITPIKDEFEPQDYIMDAAACNSNFGPVAIAGVDTRTIPANPDKINDIGNSNNNNNLVGNSDFWFPFLRPHRK
jgi:hypothetical protein